MTDNGSGATEKWKFAIGNTFFSTPAIRADGTIYVGSVDDNFYAINPDGSPKWEFATGSGVYSSPAISGDGTIYVGSLDDNLYALTDGGQGTVTQKWAPFATGGGVLSSPAIGADGTIYVGSEDGNLYAVGNSHTTPTVPAPPLSVKLAIKPKALKFARTAVDTESQPKKVTVSNPKGSKKNPGTTFAIEMVSSDPTIFGESSDCPSVLLAGKSCTISIIFAPSAATTESGTLTIGDNAKGGPQTVTLTGEGK